jgi:hypothetical protein
LIGMTEDFPFPDPGRLSLYDGSEDRSQNLDDHPTPPSSLNGSATAPQNLEKNVPSLKSALLGAIFTLSNILTAIAVVVGVALFLFVGGPLGLAAIVIAGSIFAGRVLGFLVGKAMGPPPPPETEPKEKPKPEPELKPKRKPDPGLDYRPKPGLEFAPGPSQKPDPIFDPIFDRNPESDFESDS